MGRGAALRAVWLVVAFGAALGLVLASATPALAQVDGGGDGPPAGRAAFDAFARARAVVAGEGDIPPGEPAPAWGACVTLRVGGDRLSSRVLSLDGTATGLAARAAVALDAPAGGGGALTVELLGRPLPLASGPLEEVALGIAPGLDAVVVRVGGAGAGAVFPDEQLASGLLPSEAIVLALRRALGGRLPEGVADAPGAWEGLAGRMAGDGSLAVLRAPAVVLVQPEAGLSPFVAYRGGRVVPLGSLTPESLADWAAMMADHLRGRLVGGLEPVGLGGTLDPLRGRTLDAVDGPLEQALAAHALLRYARSAWADGASADRARATGVVLLRQLAIVVPVRVGAMAELGDRAPLERAPWERASWSAMALVALEGVDEGTIARHGELGELRARCAATVRGAVERTLTGGGRLVDGVAAGERGLVARGLVALGGSPAGVGWEARVGRSIAASVAQSVPPELLVGQMPWLVGALGEGLPPEAVGPLASMRSLVVGHQLGASDVVGVGRDMAGGVVFTRGGTPLPTWQTARAAAGLGRLLGVAPARGAERAERFMELLRSLRFLRQLTADGSLEHLWAADAGARGGVRAALWVQRMPSAATGLTLLAVCEALDAAHAGG